MLLQSASPGVVDFPDHRRDWSREKQLGGAEAWKKLKGKGGGGGTVAVFSCMQPDPKTQVQPLCSPLCLEAFPNPPSCRAAKCLSIWSSIKSWLLWICLFPTCHLQRWGTAKGYPTRVQIWQCSCLLKTFRINEVKFSSSCLNLYFCCQRCRYSNTNSAEETIIKRYISAKPNISYLVISIVLLSQCSCWV